MPKSELHFLHKNPFEKSILIDFFGGHQYIPRLLFPKLQKAEIEYPSVLWVTLSPLAGRLKSPFLKLEPGFPVSTFPLLKAQAIA